MSSHHASLQPTWMFFILAADNKEASARSFAKRERESRVRQKEVEQTCEEGEEDEGDEEKDTGSGRRKDGAGVILQREADV